MYNISAFNNRWSISGNQRLSGIGTAYTANAIALSWGELLTENRGYNGKQQSTNTTKAQRTEDEVKRKEVKKINVRSDSTERICSIYYPKFK